MSFNLKTCHLTSALAASVCTWLDWFTERGNPPLWRHRSSLVREWSPFPPQQQGRRRGEASTSCRPAGRPTESEANAHFYSCFRGLVSQTFTSAAPESSGSSGSSAVGWAVGSWRSGRPEAAQTSWSHQYLTSNLIWAMRVSRDAQTVALDEFISFSTASLC